MNITKTNAQSFGARMNISQVKNYKHYWGEIADNFAKKTADTDAIMAVLNPSGVIGFGITYNKEVADKAYISCSKDCFDRMTNSSPEDAADKLAKVFALTTEANNKKANLITQIKEKYPKEGAKKSEIAKWNTLYNKEVGSKREKIMNDINKKINKSKELNGFEIII